MAIGASAGGLDALYRFFASLPAKTGMAFIVVLHLDPDQESHLAELISRKSSLPVSLASDELRVEPDHVYVIAPKSALSFEGGMIRVNASGETPRHPIDTLLRSLADSKGEKAIAIILSGSGSNGSAGVIQIKEQGGIVLVQDPETAAFDSMPISAIGTGVVDKVLAPEDMPKELLAYAAHSYVQSPSEKGLIGVEEAQLNTLLSILRARGRFNFAGYKTKTLLRRIRRRMSLNQIEALDSYAEKLRSDSEEVEALIRDLLINVTAFFRDREAWEAFEECVVRPLMKDRKAGDEIRAWVPACSTGEEAYSVAMMLLDGAEHADNHVEVKVFATDAAPHVLARARSGRFAASVAEEMPAEQLERYFEKEGDFYRAKKHLRESVMFAPQNLMSDPPFSRMDIVSCRNLLIYLDSEAQKKVTALLHFSLREGGYLVLGTAETLGEHDQMFQTVSKKWRIYRRLGPTRHDIVDFPLSDPRRIIQERTPALARVPGAAERARLALLDSFAPPSVLIDDRFHVHYFHGDTDDFLRQPGGEPTQDLLSLLRDGLSPRVRAAVHRALREGEPVSTEGALQRSKSVVRIIVTPVPRSESEPGRLLVSFIETDKSPEPIAIDSDRVPDTESELENALRASRAELRETIEELEGSNEELKASNEEITSMNEELQSTNEELETSKEELQSLNEELNTVNVQLQNKLAELEERTNDLNNLLKSSAIATLFLDVQMRIRWSTPAVGQLLDIMPTDMGRPVTHLAKKFDDPNFLEDAQRVLQALQPTEREIRTADGRWFVRRTLPYRTDDNRIDGVVVTFIDITERKHGEQDLAQAKDYAERIVKAIRQPLLVLDANCKVVSANPAFFANYALDNDIIGRKLWELGRGQWDVPELRRLMQEVLPEKDEVNDFEVEADVEGLGPRVMLLNARRLDEGRQVFLAIEDATQRRRDERRQQALLNELQHRLKNMFTNINSLVQLASRRAGSVGAFVEAFKARLAALERTQSLLSSRQDGDISVRELVEKEIEAHSVDGNCTVRLDGPDELVEREVAQALGMVVHELATNGLKHGALGHGGDLAVSWAVMGQGEELLLRWVETSDCKDKRKGKPGFGSELIRNLIPYTLGGKTDFELTDEGVRCTIETPLRKRNGRSGSDDN